jgi:formylglycine-generating enzyme required for sulfatase activity
LTDFKVLNSYQVLYGVHHSRRFHLFQATKIDTGAEVLIKTPDPARTNDKALVASLLEEARIGSELMHPRIRAIYKHQIDTVSAFMIGEYVTGRALVNQLEEAPNLQTALVWIMDILDALVHAHAKGILHLNLNPYNIIIDDNSRAKIIGFGKEKTAYLNKEESFHVYQPILFIAPELYQAGITLPASDLYSVAALAYFILCGVPPWRVDLYLSHEQQKLQSISRPVLMPERLGKTIPAWLFEIILQGLKLDPHVRPESAEAMLQAIQRQGVPILDSSIDEVLAEEEPVLAEAPEPEIEPEPVIPLQIVPQSNFEPDNNDISLAFADLIERDVEHETIPALLTTENTESTEVAQEPSFVGSDCVRPNQEDNYQKGERNLPLHQNPIIVEQDAIPAESVPAKAPEQLPKQNTNPTRMYSSNPFPRKADPEIQETKKLQNTFKILLWLTLAIVLFIVVKYFVFGSHHKFSTPTDTAQIDEPVAVPAIENKPLTLIKVPGDTLVMGNIAPDADDDEFPLLTVIVASFYISPKEVTQAEWLMVFPKNPSQFKDNALPVENISFYDAIEFCNAKSLKDGYQPCYDYYDTEVICNFEADGYRLPTEAEWEFAAKSGKHRDFTEFSGSAAADEAGWYSGNSGARSQKGAEKTANQLGLYDLSGNLFEWVWNWYAPYSYRHTNPSKGPETGTDKVIRGGSWYHPASEMRATNRNFAKPYTKNGYIGLRVVRSIMN